MTLEHKPQILVFAGPNGSGKSTMKNAVRVVGMYINADDIKMQTGCTDLEAAQEAEKLREYCLKGKKDFTFETVLSTERNLNLLRRAKEAGYAINGIFVLTFDAEINVCRIQSRIHSGGHAVSPEKVRSRYAKSLHNLRAFLALSDKCMVFDNSQDRAAVICRKDENGVQYHSSPHWSISQIRELVSHLCS